MANTKTTLHFYAIMGKEEALRTAVIRVKLLSAHFVSNLCSLLIEATTALLTLLADTDYNLSEPTKTADAKMVNPKQVKRCSVRNDRIFLEDCGDVTSPPANYYCIV